MFSTYDIHVTSTDIMKAASRAFFSTRFNIWEKRKIAEAMSEDESRVYTRRFHQKFQQIKLLTKLVNWVLISYVVYAIPPLVMICDVVS